MNDEEQTFFSQEELKKLEKKHLETSVKYQSLISCLGDISFSNKNATEFAIHGLSRRIMIMKQCIDNIYMNCPPDIDRKLSSEELNNIIINLQAFILNVYASLDNLASIWINEKGVRSQKGKSLLRRKIGFSKNYREFRKSLPNSIREYLNTKEHKKWYAYIEDFRHSLAHRIPLYVPPAVLNEKEAKKHEDLENQSYYAFGKHQFEEANRLSDEIDALGKFIPMMTHSFGEDSPKIAFHAQVLSDWDVVVKICELFIEELKSEV